MGSGYAHYFGRDHIGAINGFAKTVFVGGTAAGPLIFALGRAWLGSYMPALLASDGAAAGLAIALAFLDERKLLVKSQAALLKSATLKSATLRRGTSSR